MLQVTGITKRFAARTVLSAVSLRVAAGEYVAVVGESGVGKSTLLNIIAGLEEPDSGDVLFESQNINALGDDARTLLRRAEVGVVVPGLFLAAPPRVEHQCELAFLFLG